MPAPTFVDRNGSIVSRMSGNGASPAQLQPPLVSSSSSSAMNGQANNAATETAPAVTGWFDGPVATPAITAGSSINDRKRDGTTDSGYQSVSNFSNHKYVLREARA